jgi:fatty-acyl-CoA synthase
MMEKEKVTFACGATMVFMSMLEYIRNMGKKVDFSGMKIISGASEPPPAMMNSYYELTGAEVVTAYGATETTPFVTVNKLKPWLENRLSREEKRNLGRKHGYPVPGIDLIIVDDQGKEVSPDGKSIGEILVRGPWITRSYYNAVGTEARFTNDGYWRSGDIGVMDEEKYLKMVDRIKDLIKSGGEWISSVDMENEIMRYPGVLEATVIGLPHPRWEERPLALIVLREEFKGRVGAEDILAHLLKTFSKWQLPNRVEFLEEIPKTSVGKFNKKVLKEKYKDIFTAL